MAFGLSWFYYEVYFVVDLLQCDVFHCLVTMFYLYDGDLDR